MIRTCLFDLGNVLLRFSHDRMCRQMADVAGATFEATRAEFLESGRQLGFERGESSEEEFHAWFESFAGRSVPWESLKRAVADIFEPISGMAEILDELRGEGTRLVLLSNTNSLHIEFVRREFDLLGRFDAEVLSYEVGALKPEPAIFERALSLIECSPAECFYTDDIPGYVEAGRRFGLQAEVFESPEILREHLSRRRGGRSPSG